LIVADPWYDYLAFPLAPLVLFLQLGALFISRWRLRIPASLACFGAIVWMEHYVSGLELQGQGVNFGEIFLAFWYVVSLVLLAVAAAGEVVRLVVRHRRFLPKDP
jgi:uncharacterized membrane protein YfhO